MAATARPVAGTLRHEVDTIHKRVRLLGSWLLDELGSLTHTDGTPVATIYGPRSWDRRGATLAFNFLHPDGRIVDERYVDRVARRHRISLRTGCFCNPGAGEVAFTISRETLLGGEFGAGCATAGLPSRLRLGDLNPLMSPCPVEHPEQANRD